MAETITAFYTFVDGRKVIASELNTNFSNFRGSSIPVNSDTQTGSDLDHDLGAFDKSWNEIFYSGSVYPGKKSFTLGGLSFKELSPTTTWQGLTNGSISIRSTGRPIELVFFSQGFDEDTVSSNNTFMMFHDSTTRAHIKLCRDNTSTVVGIVNYYFNRKPPNTRNINLQNLRFFDISPVDGTTHSYFIDIKTIGGTTSVYNMRFFARRLH